MAQLKSFKELEEYRSEVLSKRDPNATCITVCGGTGCLGSGAAAVVKTFRDKIAENGLAVKVNFRETGCHGFCERGPLVVIHPQKTFYQLVKPDDVPEILENVVNGGGVIERLLYVDPTTKEKVEKEDEVPFYKKQTRIIFGNNGAIEPTVIDDYIALDGYAALAKVLREMKPEDVVEEIKRSGLRGRGGGGFLAGKKWASCRKAPGEPKYVICNADEGDPGAYMDRSLLEGNPHSVLEGMLIGAYAIGSDTGYIYVRNEYPLAVKNTYIALEQAEQMGLLGENILGTDFSFHINVNRGGGAFVCGESSALMLSLEGKPGRPRAKYIHMVENGLNGKPSNLNNVETWANVPQIIAKGADWFSKIGSENSTGTKLFSLVGKINNTGLVEVPMGMSLREIVYEIGGGIPDGKKFKGVQTGGPSGGVIPESLLDLPVDFDKLTEAGSMMGSGGMIVMDEDTCMVDVARYFINFLKDESCGKCVPCREGIRRMLQILERICDGEATEEDLELLEELSDAIIDGALCALGSTAPFPVMSTIRFFREEYEAHIKEKKCPAGVCKALITYSIDEENCNGCGACVRPCPETAITGEKKKLHVLDQTKCIKCGVCFDACKFDAIRVA